MQRSRADSKKQKKKIIQARSRYSGCKALFCGGCRRSGYSSDEEDIHGSERFQTISSIAHAMVQERLDEMIRESWRNEERLMIPIGGMKDEKKIVMVVAMERFSCDPREDFRESMKKMIVRNKMFEVRDLRRLLNYYVSMNSEEVRGLILEVFHQVCTDLFVFWT